MYYDEEYYYDEYDEYINVDDEEDEEDDYDLWPKKRRTKRRAQLNFFV